MTVPSPLLLAATASEVLLVMIFITALLVTFRVLTAAGNRDEEPFIEVTFECESCGEVVATGDQPCPVCGGALTRRETRIE